MAPTTFSNPNWSQQLYTAFSMPRNDKQNCIPILQAILSDANVPPYWRIQALVALASAVTDWYEAEEYQQEAEILYRLTYMVFPKGCDDETDGLLARNRNLLDHLALELEDTMPDSIRALREEAEAEDEQGTDDEYDDSDDDESDNGWDTDGSHDEEDEAGP
ncbi:unnamed protein product [Aureobasidium mustum]|uniref:Uncharacterized protein n=1 Tax=Aureobasidium mustum TaxID=2773714 RepID=A0A9N8PKJ4_9PEZI|nr:unnamed protein product [Aureobasidium mustum]